MPTEAELREQMCEVCRRLDRIGILGAREGNVSARVGDRLLITPRGVVKGDLEPGQLALIDLEGNLVDGPPPSTEHRMHQEFYRLRQGVRAVVHAHPPHSTAFALFPGWPLDLSVYPEALVVLGPVAEVPFGMPGTEELPSSLRPFVPWHKTFLLRNHGAVTLGSSLADAANRMETLERVAAVFSIGQGTAYGLPPEARQVLLDRYGSGRLEGEVE